MCGFVVVQKREGTVDGQRVAAAAQMLRYRGPDGSRIWTSCDKRVAMAFNRLALVGAIDESQPFSDLARDVHVVVNGEIYGYAALRSELELRGAIFATHSDCEVVLHAYLQYGTAFIAELNGEFAFVIWDGKLRTLIVARDRWGVKPLYFSVDASGVVCASEIKAILALGIPARWNRSMLFQHTFAAMSPGTTLFDGINQVKPGHIVQFRDGGRSEHCYSDGVGELRDDGPSDETEDELSRRLLWALQLAVEDRRQGQPNLACYFSGGLDSSAIAALAGKNHRPVRLFTVDFGPATDAGRDAQAVAAELRASLRVLHVGRHDLIDHFERSVWHAETIGFNAIGAAKLLLSDHARAHDCKSVLSGEGADETFGGYDFSVMDSMCDRSAEHAAHVAKMLEASRSSWMYETGLDLSVYDIPRMGVEPHPPFLLASWNYGRCLFRHLFKKDFLAEFKDSNPYVRLRADVSTDRERTHGLRRSMNLWNKSLFVSHILAAERLDMANSIETRFPFLDNRVTRIAAALPDSLLVRKSREKFALREAVKPVVPRSVYAGVKQPFQAPALAASQDAAFNAYVMETLQGRWLRESGIFEAAAVSRLLDRWSVLPINARKRLDTTLMLLLSTCVLQKTFSLQ